jgi:hypothetical protein
MNSKPNFEWNISRRIDGAGAMFGTVLQQNKPYRAPNQFASSCRCTKPTSPHKAACGLIARNNELTRCRPHCHELFSRRRMNA